MRRRTSVLAAGLCLGLFACSQGGAGPVPGPGADLAVTADLPAPADLGSGTDLRPAADLLPPLALVPSFGTPIPLSNDGSYAGMDVADVSGDGVADVILANETVRGFAVWTGRGDGTLVSRGTVSGTTTWLAASHARIADLNGDGKPDVLVSSFNPSVVLSSIGAGDGTFAPARAQTLPATPQGMVVADFNGDKLADVAVACAQSNALCLLPGKGDGTFQPVVQTPVAKIPIGVAAGDVNGDGRLDLALAAYEEPAVSLLLGKGDGTFQPAVSIASDDGPVFVALADLNRDGALDLLTTSDRTDKVNVHLGKGDGTFQPYRGYLTGRSAYGVVVTDLTGDGRADVAVADLSEGVTVFPGLGDGTLGTPVAFPVRSGQAMGLAAGDFNRDGRPDLVVSFAGGAGAAVLLNTAGSVPPT